MSLHRTDYLVSSHQAELARHAADARLARTAAGAAGTDRRGVGLGRAIAALVAAMRPVRNAVTPSVKAAGQAALTASQVVHPAGPSVATRGSSS